MGRISIRKNHLELSNVGVEDAGNYSCRVKMWQMEEYDSITYKIQVDGKFFSIIYRVTTLKLLTNLQIVYSKKYEPQMSWLKLSNDQKRAHSKNGR